MKMPLSANNSRSTRPRWTSRTPLSIIAWLSLSATPTSAGLIFPPTQGLPPGEGAHPLANRVYLSDSAQRVEAWLDWAITINSVIHVGPVLGPNDMPLGEVFRVDHPLDWPIGIDWPKHWNEAPGVPVEWIRTWYLQYHPEYLFATPYISHDPDTIHRQAWASGFIYIPESPWLFVASILGVACFATGRRR